MGLYYFLPSLCLLLYLFVAASRRLAHFLSKYIHDVIDPPFLMLVQSMNGLVTSSIRYIREREEKLIHELRAEE